MASDVLADPALEHPAVGNVTTTRASVCWEATETAEPRLRVFRDATGTDEITEAVAIEFQSLRSGRREVASTPQHRERTRTIQGAMENRLVHLARISGLQPDTDYWVEAGVSPPGGGTGDVSSLLPLRTAQRASLILESRQLIIDFSGVGDLTGTVVSLANPGSPYPLFAVVGDVVAGSRVYFDLTHFLDGAGETQLAPASGSHLGLTVGLKGGELGPGDFSGTEVAFDGTPTAARASTATFNPDELVLVATPARPTALTGHPVRVNFRAESATGAVLSDFNRPLTLASPALAGGTLETAPLVNGNLANQPVTLTTLGEQTVSVTDPVTGAASSFSIDVLAYNYDNFRTHYFGDLSNPEGDLLANLDSDPFTNQEEFAYGLDPTVLDGGMALGDGFSLVKRGGPVTNLRIDADGVDFRVTFLRPENYESLGLNYTPRFSPDLESWFDATGSPTVVSREGGMELVTYEYPLFTPDARKARFFNISVTIQ